MLSRTSRNRPNLTTCSNQSDPLRIAWSSRYHGAPGRRQRGDQGRDHGRMEYAVIPATREA